MPVSALPFALAQAASPPLPPLWPLLSRPPSPVTSARTGWCSVAASCVRLASPKRAAGRQLVCKPHLTVVGAVQARRTLPNTVHKMHPSRSAPRCASCGRCHHLALRTCAQHKAFLAARRAPRCATCGRCHQAARTCAQHKAALKAQCLPMCGLCTKRHDAALPCTQHSDDLAARRAARRTHRCAACSYRHAPGTTCDKHRAVLAAIRAKACASRTQRHVSAGTCGRVVGRDTVVGGSVPVRTCGALQVDK